MGHSGFASRRPNASNLPNFELPPPMSSHHQKHQYAQAHPSAQGHLTSVGNLLTPPSNISGDGISPVTTSAPGSGYGVQQHNGYVWSPPPQHGTPYSFQSSHASQQQAFAHPQHRPAPPYELALPPFPTSSGPMSAPTTLPTMTSHHSTPLTASTSGASAAPHPSPVHAQDSFRQPPTPGYYSQPSATPQQSPFPYSSGPSPVQQSPMSAGGPLQHRLSPVSAGPMSSMTPTTHSPHTYQRPFGQYPLPGPVLSNVQNPNGQMQLVNGNMGQSLPVGFNSGHAAHMSSIYHHPSHAPPQPQTPQADRPFKCDQCPQSFNRNHDLKRHKRIHLSVKPFPCNHCDKAFSRKDALKRHTLVKGCGKDGAGKDHGDPGDLSSSERGSIKPEGMDSRSSLAH